MEALLAVKVVEEPAQTLTEAGLTKTGVLGTIVKFVVDVVVPHSLVTLAVTM